MQARFAPSAALINRYTVLAPPILLPGRPPPKGTRRKPAPIAVRIPAGTMSGCDNQRSCRGRLTTCLRASLPAERQLEDSDKLSLVAGHRRRLRAWQISQPAKTSLDSFRRGRNPRPDLTHHNTRTNDYSARSRNAYSPIMLARPGHNASRNKALRSTIALILPTNRRELWILCSATSNSAMASLAFTEGSYRICKACPLAEAMTPLLAWSLPHTQKHVAEQRDISALIKMYRSRQARLQRATYRPLLQLADRNLCRTRRAPPSIWPYVSVASGTFSH